MKVGVQIFVTARKAITIESDEHKTAGRCVDEINRAIKTLQVDEVKNDLIKLFGAD
jgi:alkyl hydroperoxide reductase subunit AhpC